MSPHVHAVLVLLAELGLAHVTSPWLHVLMCDEVLCQEPAPRKRLPALLTHVWPLPSVAPHVEHILVPTELFFLAFSLYSHFSK